MNSAEKQHSFLKYEILSPAALVQLKETFSREGQTGDQFRQSPIFSEILAKIQNNLHSGLTAMLLKLESSGSCVLDVPALRKFTKLLGQSIGELIVQNEQGDQVVTVYDRDRLGSMNAGARYHQTREGGTIHTDNVNVPRAWRYLILSCLAAGEIGGESILVDGLAIHKKLKNSFPKALKTLESNFYWEMRGMGDSLSVWLAHRPAPIQIRRRLWGRDDV